MSIDTTNQIISNVASIYLKTDESNNLCLEILTKFIEMNYSIEGDFVPYRNKIKSKWQEIDSYPLREVTAKELLKLRLSRIPGIVYKKEDKLFYTEIPGTISLNNKEGYFSTHACGFPCSMVCNGCPRTLDLSVAYRQRLEMKFPKAVLYSWRIEKYDFVREGLETFNMFDSDEFIVLKCDNFTSSAIKHKLP